MNASMHIQIPDRVTKAWISHLSDDELKQVERQLDLDVREAEQRISQYEVRDSSTDSISFPDFGMYLRLSGRANTLRSHHDRVCAELVRRGFRDPGNLLEDGLRPRLPGMMSELNQAYENRDEARLIQVLQSLGATDGG